LNIYFETVYVYRILAGKFYLTVGEDGGWTQ
jgi:hypothetical protein